MVCVEIGIHISFFQLKISEKLITHQIIFTVEYKLEDIVIQNWSWNEENM